MAKQKRQRNCPPKASEKDVANPIQAANAMPEKLARKVSAIVSPRCAAGDSSAVQAGAMQRMKLTPTPATMRATSIIGRSMAAVCSTTPMKQINAANLIPATRPYLSLSQVLALKRPKGIERIST